METIGAPLKPSLAPSSRINILGCHFVSSSGSRIRPPVAVSPLILALITLYTRPFCDNRDLNSSGQLSVSAIPQPALRLSPRITIFPALTFMGNNKANSTRNRRNMEPIVTADDVSRQVKTPDGELSILDRITLTVMPGDAVAITGPSGSGKSTLLALLAGLEDPTRGSVHLLGKELGILNQDEKAALRAGNVGFVFQTFHLLAGLSAIENVEIALELAGYDNTRPVAADLLDRVGLTERVNHYPSQLSGGEQQRVALARAFAVNPKVLFADEPTGNLDAASSGLIADLFFDLRQQFGSALLLVTHDASLADRCDRILTLGVGGRL